MVSTTVDRSCWGQISVSFMPSGREHCRGEPGSALSGGYAPDLAKAEGSSIVDEPGEGCTPVRENQRREPRGF